MTSDEHKLDNPVWYSLEETHKSFSIDMGNSRFYHPDFCPFGGFMNDEDLADQIDRYAALAPNFYIVGQSPLYHPSLRLHRELVCDQMLPESPITTERNEGIVPLGPANRDDLFHLVNLAQPGFFRTRTAELGAYFGIYENGQLIAATGERMKMNAYTEVSAVVTHPDHTGKGYAKKLVAYTINNIFKENKIPYLHVTDTNARAIHVYEQLGFKTRRKMRFWHLVKNDTTT